MQTLYYQVEVRAEDIATMEQLEIADRFAMHHKQGRAHYWQTCRAAYDAFQEHQLNDWPGWATVLADRAGLKEPDTIRNRLAAYNFYVLASMYNKPLADEVRKEKEYSYFRVAMKYAEADEGIVIDLLQDIRTADSVAELSIHLARKYDKETDLTRFLRRLERQREGMLKIAMDGLGHKLPRHIRDDLKRLSVELENWQKKIPLD